MSIDSRASADAGAAPPDSEDAGRPARATRLHPRDRRRGHRGRPDRGTRHPLPARAQRLPPHRPRQVDLPQLRHRRGVRRPLPPPVRRHQPDQGGAGVHRRDRRPTCAGSASTGASTSTTRPTTSSSSTPGPSTSSRQGLAYVDDQSADEIRETRGTLTAARRELAVARPAGRGEPRPASRGCGPASSRTARGCSGRRSTWLSPNINLRDPILYRIVHASHPRTGDAWCIYPTYDFAHGQSDAIEGVTHSICTLEFENHRPLYDWLIEHLPVPSRPPPVRVRPAQPHPHRALEAGPPAARHRGSRPRLGRPADADDLGPPAARASRPRASATSRR